MRDDDMLYVKLGLDLSEFMRGFEDARKIAAENMAQLKKDIDSVAREFSTINEGLHVGEIFTEEDLKQEVAVEIEIKPDAEDLKEFQEDVERYKKKLADVQADLQFGDDKFGKKRAKLNSWSADEMERFKNYAEGQKAVIELYKAQMAKIDAEEAKIKKEHRDKIAEAIQTNFGNAADIEFSMTHSAFEKQIRDIERWEQAQLEKRAVGEETADIIAAAAAKEAQAFEDEMERIKGTLQSLEDKIFEQEHSQYENDLRRAQQERLKLYEDFQSKGILNADTQAMIERYFQNAVGKLNRRADESRTKGGEDTKAPEDVMHGGGNGIVVIGADQIVDNGLISAQSREIALLTDENQIRAQLATKLDAAARAEVEKIEAARALTDAQKDFIQLTQQAGGFSLIEGDKFTNQPAETQIISGNQNISVPAEELRQFSEALQQADPLQDLKNSAQEAANVQKSFVDGVKDFPPDYFKNLADNAKAVSETQGLLTKSTLNLIDAQGKFADALKNLPDINPSRDISTNDGRLNDGFLKLSTQDVRREISDIPPQKQIAQKDNGFKLGFDYDTAKDIFLTGVGIAAGATSTGVGAITVPEILIGSIVTGVLGGLAKGSYDETTAPREDYDERLKAMPANVDLSPLETSLSGIGENVQSILQSIQDTRAQENDRLQELFGALPNIEEYVKSVLLEMQSEEADTDLSEYFSVVPKISEDVQSILQAMQSKGEIPDAPALQQLQMPEPNAALVDYLTPLNNIDGKLQSILQATQMRETISFETVITPLNSINALVGNILTALTNRQPPQITVSPNNSINLGGAYVFDNALKQELVNDITKRIVDEVTAAVKQATSQSSYNYGA